MKTRKTQPKAVSAEQACKESAGVIVDKVLNVVEFLGNTGAYLQLPPGKASFNLRMMLRPGLQHAVLSAIEQVNQGRRSFRDPGVQFRVGDQVRKVNLEVKREGDPRFDAPLYRILFEDAGSPEHKQPEPAAAQPEIARPPRRTTRELRMIELQQQLLDTKDTLRAIVQEHEGTLRKLMDSNYELEQTSTELEAANAELEAYSDEVETSNRELEAVLQQRDQAEKERKELKQEVQHAEKLKSLGILAGGIAHDFNNLLAAMLGFADLALEELAPGSPARPHIEEVITASEKASELTRQMLAYSGKGRFDVRPLDLSEVVRELGSLLRTAISKKSTLKYDLADDLPSIEADPSQVRQVVMNLVTNASDALGKEGGAIAVTTGVVTADRRYLSQSYIDDHLPEGDYVYLEVRDAGCGMDDQTARKIFDPFFTTKFTGRGLGLAAVLGIVRGHNGAIIVSSEPGRGTTFQVLFGSSPKHAERDDNASTIQTLRGNGTILVVDDEDDVRKMLTRILEKHGFGVVTAADGQDGVEVFRTGADMIDAVLLDLTMPNMDGLETFRVLRRIRPAVKVILSSGYDEQDVAERFETERPAGFIQKPYRSKKLLEMVWEVLGTKEIGSQGSRSRSRSGGQ